MANGLAAGYSLVQGLRCVVSIVRGSVLFNKPLAWAIFSGDQVHPYAKSDRVFLSSAVWPKNNYQDACINILCFHHCFARVNAFY